MRALHTVAATHHATSGGRPEDRPYGRYAFLNPYNLSLFGGLVIGGWISGHHWLVVLACAAEALWLIFAPGSKTLRALWFDPAFERAERAFAEERCRKKIATLTTPDRARTGNLELQKVTIERLSRDNPSLAVDMLHDELVKLDTLVEDFVDLAITAERAEAHAQTFDFNAMRRSWQVHEGQLRIQPKGDPRHAVAEKNLSVLKQRRARYDDLCRTIQVARGQMELIEQTFRLLADEILTMGSPNELGGRIDELRLAVDAVRDAAIADEFPTFELEELGGADSIEETSEMTEGLRHEKYR